MDPADKLRRLELIMAEASRLVNRGILRHASDPKQARVIHLGSSDLSQGASIRDYNGRPTPVYEVFW